MPASDLERQDEPKRAWKLSVECDDLDDLEVTLMPGEKRVANGPVTLDDVHLHESWLHVGLKRDADAQASLELSQVLGEQRRPGWLRFGKRKAPADTFSAQQTSRMREVPVQFIDSNGKSVTSTKLRLTLEPATPSAKESPSLETGTWRIILTSGRCVRKDLQGQELCFTATLGATTQTMKCSVPVGEENVEGRDEPRTSAHEEFPIKQTLRVPGTWPSADFLHIGAALARQVDNDESSDDPYDAPKTCELALTSDKFAAHVDLVASQHLTNLADWGVQIYIEVAFDYDDGPSASARDLAPLPRSGYMCLRHAMLRGFNAAAVRNGSESSLGMRIRLGSSGESVCLPLASKADFGPSSLRRQHMERGVSFKGRGAVLMTALYEIEVIHVELFTAAGVCGRTSFTHTSEGTWRPLSEDAGQVSLAWDFATSAAAAQDFTSQALPNLWLLAVTVNKILGVNTTSSLGPSEAFVEVHVLDPGRAVGEETTTLHAFRTESRHLEEAIGETAQCLLAPQSPSAASLGSAASATSARARITATLVRLSIKSVRNVLLGECTLDIASLIRAAAMPHRSRGWTTAPLHCALGKYFLDVVFDVVQASHVLTWVANRDRGVQAPCKSSAVQDFVSLDILGARQLRRARGLIKASVEETNRSENVELTRSQPRGSASSPEWTDELIKLEVENLAQERFTRRDPAAEVPSRVWLLTARLFAHDTPLGSCTWIEVPAAGATFDGAARPLLYKSRFAGLLETAVSHTNQALDSQIVPRAPSKPASSSGSDKLTSSSRSRRRSSVPGAEAHNDNFIYVRVQRVRGTKSAATAAVVAATAISVRIRVGPTWFMTHFEEMRDDQRPVVFRHRLGPFRIPDNALAFESEVAIIEAARDGSEQLIASFVQPIVAQHLSTVTCELAEFGGSVDLEVERFSSRHEGEATTFDLAETSLYEATVELPGALLLAFESAVLSADAAVECRPFQSGAGSELLCVGLGDPALRSSLESLRFSASQADGSVAEVSYEVHQNELRLLASEAAHHALPARLAWAFQETRLASLLPAFGGVDEVLSVQVDQVQGLPKAVALCRVSLVLVSAKGASHDVLGTCSDAAVSQGVAYFAEEINFGSFALVAPVALRISILGNAGTPKEAIYERTVSVRQLASPCVNIEVQGGVKLLLSREAAPSALEQKQDALVKADAQLGPFMAAFARFDVQQTGSIPAKVVSQLVQEELSFLLPDRNTHDMSLELALLDTNSDGQVSLEEYLAWIETKRTPQRSLVPVAKPSTKLRLQVYQVDCTRKWTARLLAKALHSGAKDATESATGPQLVWSEPQVLELPCQGSLELSLVDHHSGKVCARSGTLEMGRIPDVVRLYGAPAKVQIEIIHGRGLRAADSAGGLPFRRRKSSASSDPYCVVTVGGVQKRTQVRQDTCNPDWHETLVFDVKPDTFPLGKQGALATIKMEVRDKDTISLQDDRLGACTLQCSGDLCQETMPLQGKGATGTLTVRARVIAFDEAIVKLSSEVVTEISVDALDLAISKRTTMINEALRLSEEANSMLRAMPAALRTGLEIESKVLAPDQDKRRSLRQLTDLVSRAPGMTAEQVIELHKEIQERIHTFSKENFRSDRGARCTANPLEYDWLLQLSLKLWSEMREVRSICLRRDLREPRVAPSFKSADVILRELTNAEHALRAHVKTELHKLVPGLDPHDPHLMQVLHALASAGDLPSQGDLEDAASRLTAAQRQREVREHQNVELADFIESKQSELGTALGKRRDHLRIDNRADVIYAHNLAGTKRDDPGVLAKILRSVEARAESLAAADLKGQGARLKALVALLTKFAPPKSTELIGAIHKSELQHAAPVTLAELTTSRLFPAVMEGSLTPTELAIRFVRAGAAGIDAQGIFRVLQRRMYCDQRKEALQQALCARLESLSGQNEVDAWTLMRSSQLAKTFVVDTDPLAVEADKLVELARQTAAKVVQHDFISRTDLLSLGGVLHLRIPRRGFSLRVSLDGHELAVVPGDEEDEHKVAIPPRTAPEGVLHLDLLPLDKHATTFSRILYHIEDLVKKPGVALRGNFQAQELDLERSGQGRVRVRVRLSEPMPGLFLQCRVRGDFPVPRFVSRHSDMACVWDLAGDEVSCAKELMFPGDDCRAGGNIVITAQVFKDEALRVPATSEDPVILRFGEAGQTVVDGVALAVDFTPEEDLLTQVARERAARKITSVGRGYLARRGAQLLGTAEVDLHASGLVGRAGVAHPSMSTYCSVHYRDEKLACTSVAKHSGATPDFGRVRFPVRKDIDQPLVFRVWEASSLVGKCEVDAQDLLASQRSDVRALSLRGGLRSRQGAGLRVHIVRAKLGVRAAGAPCIVRLLAQERGQGNKRETAAQSMDDRGMVEWNEGFAYPEWRFGVDAVLHLELEAQGHEKVGFALSLEHVLSQEKHTVWLKSAGSDSSLLVKVWALQCADDPARCGDLHLSNFRLVKATPWAESKQHAAETLFATAGKVTVHVLEARDLGEDASRPRVRCELLPWGAAHPDGCGETGRTWSDGAHARWTRTEMNCLELAFPGMSGQEGLPSLGVELWNADHEPIVGYATIPLADNVEGWVELEPQGRIRLRVSREAVPGHHRQLLCRVEASMCFKPKLGNTADEELADAASDLRLLEELKEVESGKIPQWLAENPRILHARNELQRSALHQAVMMRRIKVVQALLEAGADPLAVDNQGRRPMDYARSGDMLRALGLLAPHTTFVSQASQMQGLQGVLDHLGASKYADEASKALQNEAPAEEAETDVRAQESASSLAEMEMLDMLHDVVEQAHGPNEVFDLFDMDGNGRVDADEFEGCMRELLSIQSAADARLEVVRSLAKTIMPDRGGPCTRRQFARLFEERKRDVNTSNAKSESSHVADLLVSRFAGLPDLSIHSSALEAKGAIEALSGNTIPMNVARQAWLKTLAHEERHFEDAVARFARRVRGHGAQWPQSMPLAGFSEAIFDRAAISDVDDVAPTRFVERLRERFHLHGADVPARDIVERLSVTDGHADEELVSRANDHLLQKIVDLVRSEGQATSVNDFRTISRQLFETLDANGSGAVDRLEFASGMRQLGVMDASAVSQLFEMVDLDRDGRASVEEFVLHIERYIYRKQAALDSVLAALRERASRPAPGVQARHRTSTARQQMASKLAWMQRKCAERAATSRESQDKNLSPTPPSTNPSARFFFRRADRVFSTLHEVQWLALVADNVESDAAKKKETRTFEEVRITCYDEMDELLIADTGRSLRLGADGIEMLWNPQDRSGSQDVLLVRVLAKIEASKAIVDQNARKIQRLFLRDRAMRLARQEVEKQRRHVQVFRDQRLGAISLQRIVRGRQARKRRARLEMLRRRQAERRAVEFRAAQKMQAAMRGYLERNDVMAHREERRLAAVVRIQSHVRGFLLRSAERRLTQREHEAIIRAVQAPFRRGFMAQLTIDAPRLASEVLRMKLALAPAPDGESTTGPLYGLAVDAAQTGKTAVNVEGRLQALYKLLRSFGVMDARAEIEVTCFRDKRGQSGTEDILRKVIQLDDANMIDQTALDLAQAVTTLHPVHDTVQVSLALAEVLRENPAETTTGSSSSSSSSAVSFRAYRYLQESATRSFAWVQTEARTSARVYTRALELESFTSTEEDGLEDKVLRQVRALALASAEFDAYGMMRALLDGDVVVDRLQPPDATLTTQWNGTRYQISARLGFAKKRKVTAGKGYDHVPARPLCKHAELYSVLVVADLDKSAASAMHSAAVGTGDPRIMRVELSEVEIGDRSGKLLQRAVWMPPAKSKVFAQRVYLQQALQDSISAGGSRLQAERSNFRRVRWIGKLVTSAETTEQVEVDAWRLTDQSSGGLQLRLAVPGGLLGWFSVQECKSMLRLFLRVDTGPDDFFERVSKMLSPFEETGRLLTGLLEHIRDRVRAVGDARRVFLRHGFETSMPRGALTDVLKRRLECPAYLRSVEGVLDADEADELLGMFLELLPDPLSLGDWQALCQPPVIDMFAWVSTALQRKQGGMVYLRAKLRSLSGDGDLVPREQVEKALCDYLEDVGLVPEMLHELEWPIVEVEEGAVSAQALLHQLEMAHKALMGAKEDHGHSPSTGGNGDEAFPHDDDDHDEEGDGESQTEEGVDPVTDPAERSKLVQELVDSDEEEELWGRAFLSDEGLRGALAELRFRILEYANPDVRPERFDLEKTFRVFDQDRTGTVDADEFRKALQALDMEQLLPSRELIVRFIGAMDGDGDGKINLEEFTRMVGSRRPLSLLKRLRRPHALQTIRWSVELFVADIGAWVPGTAIKYRAFDNAIRIELEAHGKLIETQDIGFLQIDDYPLYLRRNLWSGKPWGREPLWKRVQSARSMRNSKSVLQEQYSAATSWSSSSSLTTTPTTARSSASSFVSLRSDGS